MSFLLLFLDLPLFAATYYVSPTGNDFNPGTLAQPWLTEKPSQRVVQPGDVVFFLGGYYTNTNGITLTASGTAAAPITYQAYTNQVPIIGPTSPSPTCITLQGNNCVINGFKTLGGSAGIIINGWSGATNNIIENCDVSGTQGSGICAVYGNCSWTIVRNCRIYNTSLCNWPRGTSGWAGALTVAKSLSTNCLFENCLVYFNNGEAIGIENANGCTVRNCIISDNGHAAMYSDGDDNLWCNNIVYCTAAGQALNGGNFGIGAYMTQEYQNISCGTNAIGLKGGIMINNLLINTDYGFDIDNFESPYTNYPFSDILFANNTCLWGSQAVNENSDFAYQITNKLYNNFHIINNIFLASPLQSSYGALEWCTFPAYKIDFGNNIYSFKNNTEFYYGTNNSYFAQVGVTNWIAASGETNGGGRSSYWFPSTGWATNFITNVLQSAATMPWLWQTNGGAAPDINVDLLFTNLATCSNNIVGLWQQLAARFRPTTNWVVNQAPGLTNSPVAMGRALTNWVWTDDFGGTYTNTAPLATDLLGTSRIGTPYLGALNPPNQVLSPPSYFHVLTIGP